MNNINKLLLLTTMLATNAYADGFSASVGGDYSTGKYGTRESTDVFYMPFSASYATGAFSYKVIVPYVRVTGPGDIVPGGFGFSGSGSGSGSGTTGAFGCAGDSRNGATKLEDNGPCASAGGTSTTTTTGKRKRTTESGLADIIVSATYSAIDTGENGVALDFTGRVKLPTASESKGLGSGKTDYAILAYLQKDFGAPYLGASLGFRKLGEPRGVDYKTVTFGALEAGYQPNDKVSFGVSYDWATSAVKNGSKPSELSLFGSYRINNQYKLSSVIYTGFSNASPDIGGGLTLGYTF